jgi:hypothetical protein
LVDLRGSVGHLQAITAPPARPPRYGLFAAADLIEDGSIWQQGVEWAPEQLHGGGTTELLCGGGSPDKADGDESGRQNPLGNPAINRAEPFIVYAADQCSTFGWEARDYEGRARRQLGSTMSYWAAKEFQLGVLRDLQSLENVALVDATPVDPAPATGTFAATDALSLLEGAIADKLNGAQAMIHCTPQMFIMLARDHIPILVGQKWQTPMGSILVPDAGYQAVDGVEWMYATGMVQYRLGELVLTPGSLSEARAQATDRATNLTTIYAEREVLFQLDAFEVDDLPRDAMFKIDLSITPWSADLGGS